MSVIDSPTAATSRAAALSQIHKLDFLPLPLRLAIRELRSGLSGFAIFIACIALGVMVITGVGALTDTLRLGLQDQGRLLIGGDLAIARMHTRLSDAERDDLAAFGQVAETSTMRTMARVADDDRQSLIELKSVSNSYPLVGQVELGQALVSGPSGPKSVIEDGASSNGASSSAAASVGQSNARKPLHKQLEEPLSAVVAPLVLKRLGISLGDTFRVGKADLRAVAVIEKEPDRLSSQMAFGPRVMVSLDTFARTGLLKPGALVRWRYAIAIPDGAEADAQAVEKSRKALGERLKDAGFTVVDRRDPSPQVSRLLERLRQFLTLVGLTALMVGGVGVANAVASFIDKRRKSIATMKSLGATGRQVFLTFLSQILIVTIIGIAIGLLAGLAIPPLVATFLGHLLPFPATVTTSLSSIVTATAYGLLVALLFALWPLGRAELVPSAVLFREQVTGGRSWPRPSIVIATVVIALALFGVSVLAADTRIIALAFSAAIVVIFGLFFALGWVVNTAARKVSRPKQPELALAIGNIGAPGGLTRSVVLSLGAGLSLLMAVALADSSIRAELSQRLPQNSPDYFVLDIPRQDVDAFRQTVKAAAPEATVRDAPMLRGRIVSLNGVAAERVKAKPDARWALRGDRGITYADTPPESATLVEGTWWAPDYDGEPLVSFEVDIARGLGLKLGDTVTVNVLGRNVSARIANLRTVEWESLAINFIMVFSPNTLRGAPTNALATVKLPEGTSLDAEAAVSRAISTAHPTTTTLRVKDAIAAFSEIFAKVIMAVRIAGGVTLVAGALVLAGALATAQRRRIQEAVILKALGATRRRILTSHALEYALLAVVTAGFAIALGALAAWATLEFVMDVRFTFSWLAAAQAVGVASLLVLVLGGLGTWQALSARPVPYLKSE